MKLQAYINYLMQEEGYDYDQALEIALIEYQG